MKRYLPPPGFYYEQHTLEESADVFNHATKCVLCWNPKNGDANCKCKNNCAVCNSKLHRHRECSLLYADIKWWRSHGHRLRKKAQVRPSLGERAYLVVAGVLKEWETIRDPVVVNMENLEVVAFYKGKQNPQRITILPSRLRPTSAASSNKGEVIPIMLKPDNDGIPAFFMNSSYRGTTHSTTTIQPYELHYSDRALDADASKTREVFDFPHRDQAGSLTAEGNDDLFELPDKKWQPSSYHEGTRYATMTPLSMRLAVTSAQQFLDAIQPAKSPCNEVRTDLDPRRKSRAKTHQNTSATQPSTATTLSSRSTDPKADSAPSNKGNENYQRELEEARQEIRAKDRRILELEIALHEAEGWTDTVSYRAGQKRLREREDN